MDPWRPAPVRSTWIGLRVWRTHQFGGSTLATDGAARDEAHQKQP